MAEFSARCLLSSKTWCSTPHLKPFFFLNCHAYTETFHVQFKLFLANSIENNGFLLPQAIEMKYELY